MIKLIILSCFFVICISRSGLALECYVCDNQEDNKGKCVTTIDTCNHGEVCLTEISWGSTPYWQQGALKQYYISKRCSPEDACATYRSRNMPTCTHIWYQDWKCSECCKGDRCNYYIISGATRYETLRPTLMIAAVVSTLFVYKYLN